MTKKEKEKLKGYWRWLVAKTEEYQERSKNPINSNAGTHFERGHADGFIIARTELENVFYPMLDDY